MPQSGSVRGGAAAPGRVRGAGGELGALAKYFALLAIAVPAGMCSSQGPVRPLGFWLVKA
ncbi:MAG: hypothetical protein ACPIOQ_05610 [Promethearchaeia archaeon]